MLLTSKWAKRLQREKGITPPCRPSGMEKETMGVKENVG